MITAKIDPTKSGHRKVAPMPQAPMPQTLPSLEMLLRTAEGAAR